MSPIIVFLIALVAFQASGNPIGPGSFKDAASQGQVATGGSGSAIQGGTAATNKDVAAGSISGGGLGSETDTSDSKEKDGALLGGLSAGGGQVTDGSNSKTKDNSAGSVSLGGMGAFTGNGENGSDSKKKDLAVLGGGSTGGGVVTDNSDGSDSKTKDAGSAGSVATGGSGLSVDGATVATNNNSQ